MMNELNRLKTSFKEDIERKYLELLEYKNKKDREFDELKVQFNLKTNTISDLERKYQKAKSEQVTLED